MKKIKSLIKNVMSLFSQVSFCANIVKSKSLSKFKVLEALYFIHNEELINECKISINDHVMIHVFCLSFTEIKLP